MERGRLLSDHRGQPSPRRAESYISARRPATPAGGRCSKYRPEASPVGFGRPVRPKRCGSPAFVPTECAAQSASRDGAAFGRKPCAADADGPTLRKPGPQSARNGSGPGRRPCFRQTAVSKREPHSTFGKNAGLPKRSPPPRREGAGALRPRKVGPTGGPPPVRYRSPANALSRAISSGQRSSSGVSRMSGMSSNRASRAM